LFAQGQVAQGPGERVSEPVLNERQSVGFVVEVTDELGAKIFARGGKVLRKPGQRGKKLSGIAPVGGDKAVGPESRGLPFPKFSQGFFRQGLDGFDQGDAQDLRQRPELADTD
jgi:hypothetical protein